MSPNHASRYGYAWLLCSLLFACEEEPKKETAAPRPSAAASAPVAAAPSAEPPPPPKLRDDCPKGSSGVGTSDKPCLGSGDTRMMEVAYTGKTTDQGPKFSIVNKADNQILFGSLVVYFYDKSGKKLDVKDSEGKTRPYRSCGGNIFSGVMHVKESAVLTFSCLKQSDVPDGTAAIDLGYAVPRAPIDPRSAVAPAIEHEQRAGRLLLGRRRLRAGRRSGGVSSRRGALSGRGPGAVARPGRVRRERPRPR